MHEFILSLGSNLGDRLNNLQTAVSGIKSSVYICDISCSSVYESQPQDMESENLFLNIVLKAKTSLSPDELLTYCKTLEKDRTRDNQKRYSDRHIDIDILFYDDLVLNTYDLIIPHPRLNLRRFVLVPLCEVAHDLTHPVLNKTVQEMLSDLKYSNLLVTKFNGDIFV